MAIETSCSLAIPNKRRPWGGGEPLFKEGDYTGKGQNKPKGATGTPAGAWTTHKLVRMAMAVRNGFQDVAILRKVHRYCDECKGLSAAEQERYRSDAVEFLRATRGMADCTWTREQHA